VRKYLTGAAVVALIFVAVPGVAQAQTEPCPDRVAAAQEEFDAAVEAARLRLVELGADERNVRELLALVDDYELSPADQNEAQRIYERSGFVYTPSIDAPADLAKLNRILTAASELDEARNAGCEVPEDRDPAPAPVEDVDCGDVSDAEAQRLLDEDPSDPHNLDADNDGQACDLDDEGLSQVGNVPAGGVETGAP